MSWLEITLKTCPASEKFTAICSGSAIELCARITLTVLGLRSLDLCIMYSFWSRNENKPLHDLCSCPIYKNRPSLVLYCQPSACWSISRVCIWAWPVASYWNYLCWYQDSVIISWVFIFPGHWYSVLILFMPPSIHPSLSSVFFFFFSVSAFTAKAMASSAFCK